MVLPMQFGYPSVWLRLCATLWLMVGARAAGEAAWDERLAGAFSARWKEIKREQAELTPRLDSLPGIPIDDQGGTGGHASIHSHAQPLPNTRYAVEVRWPAKARVDMVALVPARRYDARGLDAHYGLPDAFTVDLIDDDGKVLAGVARERNARTHPVRKGHPFVYQISPAVMASGLRITAGLLIADPDGGESFIHAWAEVLAFEGMRNIAQDGKVRSLGGSQPAAPWHWDPAFLVDGQTPLGLPEIPAGEHGNIGWISEARAKASDSASLMVDLGANMLVDAVRLIPAKKPTSDLPSGFGFPRKFVISIAASDPPGEPVQWQVLAKCEMRNPGHNPVRVSFDAIRGRYVRIVASELWKDFDNYPAFFALSEVEVLAGEENVALGKVVSSPDGMLNIIASGGRIWSSASLSDGFGPTGKLVSTREWITQLDRRLRIETRLHELRGEAARLVAGWRRAGLTGFAVLGLTSAFLIVALPIRYRRHANREMIKVRERIAGDLHDEVGSNLGSIQMFADLAEGRSGPSDDLKRIQRIAAETVSAVRDIVWLLRTQGDHRIGTVEHLRETSSIMLEILTWKFTANEEAWQVELPEEATRHLFLFFREALHNILRHARASKVDVHVEATGGRFLLTIADDGVGIDPDRLERPATLHALRQRSAALGAELRIESRPAEGTRLTLSVPLERKRPRKSREPA